MNKEKEIEEMKQVLVDYAKAHDLCFSFEAYRRNAETLYNARYRNCANVGIDEFVEKYAAQARKETAREILQDFFDWLDFDDYDDNSFIPIMKKDFVRRLKEFYEKYGVEVEE